MGARLVGLALDGYWAEQLNDTAHLVLIRMAHSAQDGGPHGGQ